MAVRPEDIQLWTSLISAASPAIGVGVQAVLSVIRLVRRTTGQPEVQPGDELLAAEVVQSLAQAQKPWATIGDVADAELKKGL